jgi:retron-type reverse transcriptase
MNIIDFRQLSSLKAISINFGIALTYLESVIAQPDKFYTLLKIRKKGRSKYKYRKVYKADEQLALFHSEIRSQIEFNIYDRKSQLKSEYVTPYAYGFIKKRGIRENAKVHLNKTHLLNLDITDFFKSIKSRDVYNVFVRLGTPDDGAKILATLCTLHNKLEEGLHTSPLISNIHCYDLDIQIAELAKKYKFLYSRYADDLTFSSNTRVPYPKQIEKILNSFGFDLNYDKTRYSKKGQAQYVTGLSISNEKYPRIPKIMKSQLRTELYFMEKYGVASHCHKRGIDQNDISQELNRIQGWIWYMYGIEPELAAQYKEIFDECIGISELDYALE